jgi:phage portal protein BeeE
MANELATIPHADNLPGWAPVPKSTERKSGFNEGDWVSGNSPGNVYSSGRIGYDWNPGTSINYGALAGDLWNSSICQAILNWIIRAWPESYPCVKQKGTDGKKVVVEDHPLTEILLDPNQFDDDTVLWASTIISYWCDGNAYWRINRTRGGQVAEFEHIPYWAISPYRAPDSTSSGPDFYKLRVIGGRTIELPVYDIVHYRFGRDPYNDMLGMSPWASVSREVYTDNEAVNYTASMLRNKGAAWMIVSPKADMGYADPEGTRDIIEARTTGDNRHRVLVMETPSDITLPPERKDMGMMETRRFPESRAAALAGIPGMCVGFASAQERSTFQNTEQAEGAAWNTIVAVQRMLGRQLTKQVLWRKENYGFKPNTIFAGFDYSEVRALQPDTAGEWDRIGKAYDRGLIDDDEARADMGLDPFTAKQRADQLARAAAAVAASTPAPGTDHTTQPANAAGKPARNGASNGNGKAHSEEPDLKEIQAEFSEEGLTKRILRQIAARWE